MTRLELSIAWRYLRSRRGSKLLSLISLIAIGGVTVAVSALIVIMGVMNGLQNDLREKILIGSPDIRVLTYGEDMVMTDWRAVLEKVAAAEGRRDGRAVRAHAGARSRRGGTSTWRACSSKGLPPDGPDTPQVTTIRQRATAGDFTFRTADGKHRGAVLGSKLAEKLNVTPGIDSITLMTVDPSKINAVTGMPVPKTGRFEVTGIFDTGMYEYDNSYVIVALDAAQDLAQLGQAVTGFEVKTPTRWEAPDVSQRLQDSLGMPFRLQDWHQQNSSLFNALKLEKLGMGVILLLIALVAAFNIISTLIMVVTDKTKEIGILRAMGMPARSIRRVFFAQGLAIGVVGTARGIGHRDRGVGPDRREEAHPPGSGRIFHRSPPCLDAAARRHADRAGEPGGGGAGDDLSGVAGGAALPGGGDSSRMIVLEAVDLAKVYEGGDGRTITVLDGTNLQVARGEMVAIVGSSGAGRARCCTSSARSTNRRAAPSRSAASRSPAATTTSCRRSAITQWVSSSSFTICCANFRRGERDDAAADRRLGRRARASARAEELLERVGSERPYGA